MHCRREFSEPHDNQRRKRQWLENLAQSMKWQNSSNELQQTSIDEVQSTISALSDLYSAEHGHRVLCLEQTLDEYCHKPSRHNLELADDLCQDNDHSLLVSGRNSEKYCREPARHNIELLTRRDKDQVLARYMNQPELSNEMLNQNDQGSRGEKSCEEPRNGDQGCVVVVSQLIVWRFGGLLSLSVSF